MADSSLPATDPAIDFWFDFASHYSYFAAMRIEAAAATAGVRVRWRPFLLGPIFQAFGWNNSPFVLQKEKGDYTWRDLERQSRKSGIAWRRPSVFPRRTTIPMRVASAHADAPWIGAFCRELMARNFVRDEEIDSLEVVQQALAGLGLDAAALIAEAELPDRRQRLRQTTEQAQALRIFGAPTFIVAGEMFWGNDRLDDAIAWAAGLQKPSALQRDADRRLNSPA